MERDFPSKQQVAFIFLIQIIKTDTNKTEEQGYNPPFHSWSQLAEYWARSCKVYYQVFFNEVHNNCQADMWQLDNLKPFQSNFSSGREKYICLFGKSQHFVNFPGRKSWIIKEAFQCTKTSILYVNAILILISEAMIRGKWSIK